MTKPKRRPAPLDPRADVAAREGPAPTRDLPHAPPPGDPLRLLMPAGEQGVRNDPAASLATESGGTSRAEDTSRTAGYVADLTGRNDPPPGPPVKPSPEKVARPDDGGPGDSLVGTPSEVEGRTRPGTSAGSPRPKQAGASPRPKPSTPAKPRVDEEDR